MDVRKWCRWKKWNFKASYIRFTCKFASITASDTHSILNLEFNEQMTS